MSRAWCYRTLRASHRLVSGAFMMLALCSRIAEGHFFVPETDRSGAYPAKQGSGWIAHVFLNIPVFPSGQDHLITAQNYVAGRLPDFTFHTPWIDFPAGPNAFDLDAHFETVGDFFDDYITDVSDPAKLEEPMSSMFVRFKGFVRVTLEDEVRVRDLIGLPIWVEFGTFGYDGYSIKVGSVTTNIRVNVNVDQAPWFNWGPAVQAQGVYPIEVAYFNRHDPTGILNAPFAGVEVYSWHGGGLALPMGEMMVHETRGPGTLLPPRIIYQRDDILPLPKGDFDADADVDFRDYWWFGVCFGGAIALADGCSAFDFEEDIDVDFDDYIQFVAALNGP